MKLIDLHCDTISAMQKQKRAGIPYSLLKNQLHVDLKKLKKGDYLLQNFALFVKLSEHADPWAEVLSLAKLYHTELDKNASLVAPVLSYSDIEKNRLQNKLSAMLTVEEGGVCLGNLSKLTTLYQLGVRMLTLTWNFPNELGFPNIDANALARHNCIDNSFFQQPEEQKGLTETGIIFLEEMEKIGMIVDVSHLSDAGFYDVYHHTKKPFVASHSNARALCPFVRNATDAMIRIIAERGGVLGLNLCPDFLTLPSNQQEVNPGTISAVVDHAQHIKSVGGIECLAFGTDFDGIEGHQELPDASYMPLLLDALKKASFTETEIDYLAGKNVLRVYKECLR